MYAFISGYGMTAKSEEKNLKLLDDIKQAINQIINFFNSLLVSIHYIYTNWIKNGNIKI